MSLSSGNLLYMKALIEHYTLKVRVPTINNKFFNIMGTQKKPVELKIAIGLSYDNKQNWNKKKKKKN